MRTYRIAAIGGDGIGPEVVEHLTASVVHTPDLGGKATTAQVTRAVKE